ncbi:MAG: long-chain fatty acid--CoA ligase [Leptolyngbya sp. Prado105]|jgi:1,4-alpha-glucan branching enzyme|nr:long-chain fatty acid--CoA ligase [Leptolyngbya sp. Prado105]
MGNRYQPVAPNQRGHYEISSMGVELGIWQGQQYNQTLPWLRWWDAQGNLLLSAEEREEQEKQRAEQEKQRADRLAAQLRSLGIEPEDAIGE